MTLALFIILGLVAVAYGLVPIPTRKAGFVYKSESFNAPVHLDIFIDQICPDSKRAWPTILQIADHYGPSKLRLTTHEFPLPYHRNGYFASKGAFIVQNTGEASPYTWIQKVFDSYDSLTGSANKEKSDSETLGKLAKIANGIGIKNSTFMDMFMNSTIESQTRVEWKYACSRRVAETPTFMLNDVVVAYTDGSYWSVEKWKTIIDPLLGITPPATKATTVPPASNSDPLCPKIWMLAIVMVSLFRL